MSFFGKNKRIAFIFVICIFFILLLSTCCAWYNPNRPDDWTLPVESSKIGLIDIEGVYRNSAEKCTKLRYRANKNYQPSLSFVFGYNIGDQAQVVYIKKPEKGILEIKFVDKDGLEFQTISFIENKEFFIFPDRIEIRHTATGRGGDTPSGFYWDKIFLYKNQDGDLLVKTDEGFSGGLYFIPMTMNESQWCQYSRIH